MGFRSTAYDGLQLGPQTVFGTGVAASKKILSLGTSKLKPKSKGGLSFRGQGNKLPSAIVPPSAQWSELDYNGLLDFQAFPYLGCGVINNTTPSPDGTNGKKWEFAYSLNAPNTKKLYTVEIGASDRAKKAIDGFFNSMDIEMGREIVPTISGGMIAGKRQDDITITATPTELAPKIVSAATWNVYVASTQAGLDAASKFPMPLKAKFSIPQVALPRWRMNSSDPHYAGIVEQPLEPMLSFTTGDDDDDFATFLDDVDAGTLVWFRFVALGAAIAGAVASQEKWQLDGAFGLIEPESPEEEESQSENAFNFHNIYESVAGYSFKITDINTLASL
jgi:hypothetical protein